MSDPDLAALAIEIKQRMGLKRGAGRIHAELEKIQEWDRQITLMEPPQIVATPFGRPNHG